MYGIKASNRQYIQDSLPISLCRLLQISAKRSRLVSVPPLTFEIITLSIFYGFFFFQYRKKNEMRRFLRRNEMRAAYWKQTCFFFFSLTNKTTNFGHGIIEFGNTFLKVRLYLENDFFLLNMPISSYGRLLLLMAKRIHRKKIGSKVT